MRSLFAAWLAAVWALLLVMNDSVTSLPDYGYYRKSSSICKPKTLTTTSTKSRTLTSTATITKAKTTRTTTKTVPGPMVTKLGHITTKIITNTRTLPGQTVTRTSSVTIPASVITKTFTTTRAIGGIGQTTTVTGTLGRSHFTVTSTIISTKTLSGSEQTITTTRTTTISEAGKTVTNTATTTTTLPAVTITIPGSIITEKHTETLTSTSTYTGSGSRVTEKETETFTSTSTYTEPGSTVTSTQITTLPATTVSQAPVQPSNINIVQNSGFEESSTSPISWTIDETAANGQARAYVTSDPSRVWSGRNALQFDFDQISFWGPSVHQNIFLYPNREYTFRIRYRSTQYCYVDPTISQQMSLFGFDGLPPTNGEWREAAKTWTVGFNSGYQTLVVGTSVISTKPTGCEISIDDIYVAPAQNNPNPIL